MCLIFVEDNRRLPTASDINERNRSAKCHVVIAIIMRFVWLVETYPAAFPVFSAPTKYPGVASQPFTTTNAFQPENSDCSKYSYFHLIVPQFSRNRFDLAAESCVSYLLNPTVMKMDACPLLNSSTTADVGKQTGGKKA